MDHQLIGAADGQVGVFLVLDDATKVSTGIRFFNLSAFSCTIVINNEARTRETSRTIPPGTPDTTVSIAAAKRITLSDVVSGPPGRLTGLIATCFYPGL
jgi:hypothetical protein